MFYIFILIILFLYANNRKSMIYDEKKPLIMGVLNITDDSFFDKSRILSKTMLFDKIKEMLSLGVFILDIGACSTRPDSSPVSLEEELARLESVMPFLKTCVRYMNSNPLLND